LLLSFYLFVGCVALMVLMSLCTSPRPGENRLPSLSETRPHLHRSVWVWWGVLGVVMGALYVVFN
jgi:hypothetical protein